MSAQEDDDYRSSDDEDYVPQGAEEDVDEPSGDEMEEVTGKDGEIVQGNRRQPKKKESCIVESKNDDVDVDALFAELTGQDPLRVKAQEQAAALQSFTSGPSSTSTETKQESKPVEEKRVVKEVFDFAGDAFTVERTVSEEEYKKLEEKEKMKDEKTKKPAQKRTGLGEALKLLSKKPKISVLDKSNHDWKSFKNDNDLNEDLESHNRGKGGYLNRMDFLSRTDHREFEQEKSMRLTSRKN